MKLQNDASNVERHGIKHESSFTIKTTAKAFDILSSGLYSDKITAVIRELSCNAYDAHVAASNEKTPFEIHLPNALEPYFSVKDYGTGLSEEQVFGLYTTYFDSTKTESNDFIGALGLGSKSPFSYTKSFEVMVRYDHVLTTYSIFINEDGVPTVAKLGAIATTETNGLEVRLSVHSSDFWKFQEKASDVFMFFPTKPIVKGNSYFSFTTPELVSSHVQGSNWKAYKGIKSCVVQGNVRYDLDTSLFKDELTDWERLVLENTNLVFFFEIGELEVAASREALQYNKHTKENLVKRVRQAADEFEKAIIAAIDAKKKSFWDTCLEIERLSKELFHYSSIIKNSHGMRIQHPILTKYVNSDGCVQVPTNLLKYHRIVDRGHHWQSRGSIIEPAHVGWGSSAKPNDYIDVSINDQPIIHVDIKRGAASAIKQYLEQKHCGAYCIQQTEFADKHQLKVAREYKKIVAALGKPSAIIKASVLPAAVSTQAKTPRAIGYTMDYDGKLKSAKIDLEEGGFYVLIKKKRVMDREKVGNQRELLKQLREVVQLAEHLGFKKQRTIPPLYGITVLAQKEVEKNPKWINIWDVIKKAEKKWGKILDQRHTVSNDFNTSFYRDICNKLPKTSTFKKMITDHNAVLSEIRNNYHELDILSPFHRTEKDAKIKNVSNEINNKYPLISVIRVGTIMDTRIIDAVVQYIKLVDKE